MLLEDASERLATDQLLSWYAIRSTPRHEKRVRDRLEAHRVECFLPITKATHRWNNGVRREVEVPLFPTYLFVRTMMHGRFVVLGTQGVRCFVGTAGMPSSISDHEIESLRAGLSLADCQPYPHLAQGDHVRILRGPFSGLTGIVVRNSRNPRVVVTISVIMQGVSVELDARDIELVRSKPAERESAQLLKTA
jgi:transcription antitermination factor NusG